MFIGLVQYLIDGKKYISPQSLVPTEPIEKENLHRVVTWIIAGVVVVLAFLGGIFLVGQLNIENIINMVTVLAFIVPIAYFIIMLKSKEVTHKEKKKVQAYIPLWIAAVAFWSIEESGSVVLALFAAQRTVLHIGSWHYSAANFQVLNPLFIMILTPIFVWLWNNWKNQPSSPKKFSGGLLFAGASYIWMALPGIIHGTTAGKVSPFWLVGSWFICMIGEMLLSPIGLSVTARLAPKAFSSQMMSLWLLADAAAQAINAQIVKFYSTGTEVPYFLSIGAVSVVLGIVLLLISKRIFSLMEDEA